MQKINDLLQTFVQVEKKLLNDKNRQMEDFLEKTTDRNIFLQAFQDVEEDITDDFYVEDVLMKPLKDFVTEEYTIWTSVFQHKLLLMIFRPDVDPFGGRYPRILIHGISAKPTQRKLDFFFDPDQWKTECSVVSAEQQRLLDRAEVLVATVEVFFLDDDLTYLENVELSVLLQVPVKEYRDVALTVFETFCKTLKQNAVQESRLLQRQVFDEVLRNQEKQDEPDGVEGLLDQVRKMTL